MARRKAKGRYDFGADETHAWDERAGAPRLEEMKIVGRFSGDIEAEGTERSVVARCDDGTGSVCGIVRVVGTIAGRTGSFLLRQDGTRNPSTWEGPQWVIPSSGTGELTGLRGEGQWTYPHHAKEYSWTLEYWFD